MAETTTLKTIREAVADDLGLLINGDITVAADPDFTFPVLADKAPDRERLRDAYLYQGGVWRRILSLDATGTIATVSRTGSGFTATAAQVYSMLDPEDMNGAINEALSHLYFVDSDTIMLLANTRTYVLPSWIQQKGQVVRVDWRDISLVATKPQTEPVESYSLKENANIVTLYINEVTPLRSVTTYDMQVEARHNYSKLANDSATTTCPYPMLFGVAKAAVLRKIFTKYGKAVASVFGPKMAVAEREEASLKSDWLPRMTSREYVEEENWNGPDLNPAFEAPAW